MTCLGESVPLSLAPTLFYLSRSKVKLETKFTAPPTLDTLGGILCVVEQESIKYKLFPVCICLPTLTVIIDELFHENCYFSCSVIYEILFAIGEAVDINGAPSRFVLPLAPDVRVTIHRRMNEAWFAIQLSTRPSTDDDIVSIISFGSLALFPDSDMVQSRSISQGSIPSLPIQLPPFEICLSQFFSTNFKMGRRR